MSDARAFRSRRVITPDGEAALCVIVRNGVIAALEPYDALVDVSSDVDAGDVVLMPGVVDTHVHLNDPGRAEWEGFDSGTRAAAAGGITTLVDMPLNSIPATTTVTSLEQKRSAARGRLHVDVGMWGGVVRGNAGEITALWDAGVLGFKCFLVPSGVAEFEHVSEGDLRRVLPDLASLRAPLLVHAEHPLFLCEPSSSDSRSYAVYLATRPDAAEVEAARMMIGLSRETGARVHFVHIASAAALPLLRAARADGLPITAETCPHYLHFAAESIGDGRTELKCAPPIRSAANREQLWQALVDGDLDLVASDHSPAPPQLKQGSGFLDAWGGIASLQVALPVVWTGARARGIPMSRVVQWMCAAPSGLAGLSRKGAIAVGNDADLVVFDTEAEWTVDARALHHRHSLTPYDGARLSGVVRATYVRGELAYDIMNGHTPPHGRLIDRRALAANESKRQWISHS